MSPIIRDPILGGELRISGSFAPAEMTAIAQRIAAGTAKVEADVQAP
jgi:hypothetical protein